MNMDQLSRLKGMSQEEFVYIQELTRTMDPTQQNNFVMFYSGKRKDPQEILLFTLLGFLGIAGIQRFIIGDMGMGILYILTCGLCFIGTIVDVINYRSLALDFNRRAAFETAAMLSSMPPR